MTDERTDRELTTEPVELTDEEIEILLQALRLLQATLGREEADELADLKRLIAKLGASPNL